MVIFEARSAKGVTERVRNILGTKMATCAFYVEQSAMHFQNGIHAHTIDGCRFTGTFISEDLQCYRRQPINILRHEMVRLRRGSDGLQIAGYGELRKKDVGFIGFCLECSKCMISQCVESSKQRPTFAFDSDKTAIQGMDFQQMQLALLSLSHQEIATFLHHL